MRISSAAALLLSSAEALQPSRRAPKAVSLPIQRRNIEPQIEPSRDRARLRKRQNDVVEVQLDNTQSLYFTNVTVGTPGQTQRLHMDTGSSDMWVNVPGSALCRQRGGCAGGTYDSSQSSTYKLVNEDFNISYVDGSGATGDYVTDDLGFSGVTIDSFQFGTGQTSTSDLGVLGIGYARNEAQVIRARGDSYPNLPQRLKDDGHTASNVYSLWLNDLDASTGEILFGGVDSAKYTGSLATVPMIPTNGNYYQLIIAMTGLTVNGQNSTSSDLPVGVLLDSGATLSYLPQNLAEEAFTAVNAVWNSNVGAAYADCNLANTDQSLDFTFSGKTISVPYNELIINDGTNIRLQNGDPACVFGISQVDGHIAVLGDTFLRSAYVVYDLENNEISLAQTVYNATASDVQAITSSGGSIPGATAVSNPVTNVALDGSDGARLGGPSGSSNGARANAAFWGWLPALAGVCGLIQAL